MVAGPAGPATTGPRDNRRDNPRGGDPDDPGASPTTTAYRSLSYWHDSLPPEDTLVPRRPLPGDRDADVVVVGAGFTGLWTAYYLLAADPALRVVVLEREVAGFGASGRNGGWCSSLFPATWESLASASSRDDAVRLQRALDATVDEVGRVVATEGIEADWAKGGTVSLARSATQLRRARSAVEHARAWGRSPDDLRLLGADEASRLAGATHVLGGTFTPHCAALHPARLVRGLARAVERRGGVVHEATPVLRLEPGRAVTPYGSVRAEHVVRATEGYTPMLPGHRRTVMPVYSLLVATEPLPASAWERIGLAERPTFTDLRHMIVYGQRTADGRLAFGGRGAPYRAGSRVHPDLDRDERVFGWLRRTLADAFPEVRQARFTHAWGGPLGIARDWWASVGVDRATGAAWAGGYVGDGVATSNLAGRTLADLLVGRDSDLVTLPWVGHRSRRWEPEPLRWLGVNASLRAMGWADAEEQLTGRESLLARTVSRAVGA
ncbi:MAG TPA: FAD-binding oxidoreductase [Jiangellales bacterium]|nr:FAD-binding oxidoreductase [Jiangellales bacterium]